MAFDKLTRNDVQDYARRCAMCRLGRRLVKEPCPNARSARNREIIRGGPGGQGLAEFSRRGGNEPHYLRVGT